MADEFKDTKHQNSELENPNPHPKSRQKMADEFKDTKHQNSELENPNPHPKSPSMALPSLSLNIWRPSQCTREAVTNRLVDTLSSPSSVLAKRYGIVPHDDAIATAEKIEKEAFTASEESASDEARDASVDGGMEMLEIYSKAISSRMLETMKARNPSPAATAPSPPSVASLSLDDAEARGGKGAEMEAPSAA